MDKIKKYKIINLILFQIIIIILLILIFNINHLNHTLTIGNIFISDRTTSNWQFINKQEYNNDFLSNIYKIRYYNIINTTHNGYLTFEGHIMLLNKNNEVVGLFKEFSTHEYYYDFIYNFKEIIKMENELYNVGIEDNLLKIMYYNNCSKNICLDEKNGGCFFKENIFNDINIFLEDYFYEKLILS